MKRFILFLIIFIRACCDVNAQIAPDSGLVAGTTSFTPQFRYSLLGGKLVPYLYNNQTGKYYPLYTAQTTNTYFYNKAQTNTQISNAFAARTLTINGTTYDLSANRTWTVSANTSNSLTNGYGINTFTFNGSSAATASVDTSATGLRTAANSMSLATLHSKYASFSGSPNDLDLGSHQYYGGGITAGGSYANALAASFYNSSATGKGLQIQAGTTGYAAIDIYDYANVRHAWIDGNGVYKGVKFYNTAHPAYGAADSLALVDKKQLDAAVAGAAPTYTASNGVIKTGNNFASDTTYNRTVANSLSLSQLQTKFNGYVPATRTLTGGLGIQTIGDLSANRTVGADTTVLKSKTSALTDYNNLSTGITNLKNRNINTGLGLSGGGNLTADRTIIADTTVLKSKAAALTDYNNLKTNLVSQKQYYVPIIYQKSYWSDLTDFTSSGLTASIDSGYAIKLSATGGVLTNTLVLNNNINADEQVDFDFWGIASSLGQFGCGKQTISSSNVYSVYAIFDASVNRIYLKNAAGTVLASSSVTFTTAAGDFIKIRYSQRGATIYATVFDITQNLDYTISATGNLAAVRNFYVPNDAHFTIVQPTGNFRVKGITIKSNQYTQSDVACMGDSKTMGYSAGSQTARWDSQINQLGVIDVFGGDGDRTVEMVQAMPYYTAHFKPKYVLLCAGRNDLATGVAAATWQANYQSIVNQWQSIGATVVHLLPLPELKQDQTALRTWILANYTNTIDASSISSIPGYLSTDSVHLSEIGHRALANIIVNSGKMPILSNTNYTQPKITNDVGTQLKASTLQLIGANDTIGTSGNGALNIWPNGALNLRSSSGINSYNTTTTNNSYNNLFTFNGSSSYGPQFVVLAKSNTSTGRVDWILGSNGGYNGTTIVAGGGGVGGVQGGTLQLLGGGGGSGAIAGDLQLVGGTPGSATGLNGDGKKAGDIFMNVMNASTPNGTGATAANGKIYIGSDGTVENGRTLIATHTDDGVHKVQIGSTLSISKMESGSSGTDSIVVHKSTGGLAVISPFGVTNITVTATDANYTITGPNQFVKLPAITAARTVTMPSASSSSGMRLTVWNQNTSANTWSFASGVVDATGATITTLSNTTIYQLMSDGTNWVKIN